MIVANVWNEPLTEDIFLWALDDLLRKRKPNGAIAFSSIDAVLYIPLLKKHLVQVPGGGPPLARCRWVYRTNGGREGHLRRMIEIIIAKWAKFNGAGYLEHSDAVEYTRSGRLP